MIAGPSEILVLADESADPKYLAADLMSQAEHDPMASAILVTTSENLARETEKELERQIETLSRKDIIRQSLSQFGAMIVCDTMEEAVEFANELAPEHLEACVKNPMEYIGKLDNVGSLFLGNYAPEPLGDYYAGPCLLYTSVRLRGGEVVESFDTFVNAQRPIPPKITQLTGITDEMVKDAPSEEGALEEFFRFCGEDAVLIAHNADFDTSFIRTACSRCGRKFRMPYIDSIPMCRSLLKDIKNFKLDTVAKYLKPVSYTHLDVYKRQGMDGLCGAASLAEADLICNSVVGMVGLEPTLAAIEAGKDIALSNKETLVAGGALVMERAEAAGVSILPVDSEHSAVFQCLQGSPSEKAVSRIILTASGGPFFGRSRNELEHVTVQDALNHPNWDMGAKITVDSASMMNKGLEIIEASWLFHMPQEKIDVVVHLSLIHI